MWQYSIIGNLKNNGINCKVCNSESKDVLHFDHTYTHTFKMKIGLIHQKSEFSNVN